MNKDTGGPIHPIERSNAFDYNGMNLRDHFAGLVMQGMLAGTLADGSELGDHCYSIFPQVAYKMADAMIAERSK